MNLISHRIFLSFIGCALMACAAGLAGCTTAGETVMLVTDTPPAGLAHTQTSTLMPALTPTQTLTPMPTPTPTLPGNVRFFEPDFGYEVLAPLEELPSQDGVIIFPGYNPNAGEKYPGTRFLSWDGEYVFFPDMPDFPYGQWQRDFIPSPRGSRFLGIDAYDSSIDKSVVILFDHQEQTVLGVQPCSHDWREILELSMNDKYLLFRCIPGHPPRIEQDHETKHIFYFMPLENPRGIFSVRLFDYEIKSDDSIFIYWLGPQAVLILESDYNYCFSPDLSAQQFECHEHPQVRSIELPSSFETVSPDGKWLRVSRTNSVGEYQEGVLSTACLEDMSAEGCEPVWWDILELEPRTCDRGQISFWSPDSSSLIYMMDPIGLYPPQPGKCENIWVEYWRYHIGSGEWERINAFPPTGGRTLAYLTEEYRRNVFLSPDGEKVLLTRHGECLFGICYSPERRTIYQLDIITSELTVLAYDVHLGSVEAFYSPLGGTQK